MAILQGDEFAGQLDQKDFFIAYVLSRDPNPDKPAYQGDIFIFPIRDFDKIIRCGISSKGQRKVYISRLKGEAERWVLRRETRFLKISDKSCLDVTAYRRNAAPEGDNMTEAKKSVSTGASPRSPTSPTATSANRPAGRHP